MPLLKFVKRNVRRAPYQAITASMVMFLTFLVLSVFLILALGSQQILKYYESKPQAIAFFKDGTADIDIAAIRQELELTGKVTNLKYISKEEALQIYKERNKDKPILLELVTANILPASLEISAFTPKDLKPISEILKKEPVVEEVVYPEDVVASLSKATTIIRWVGLGLVSFLIVFSTLVILMVIGFKIRLRRTEIETMRLLGASNWFIRAPFILEGIFYGITGATYAWLVSYGILWYFGPFIQKNLADLNLYPVSPLVMGGLLLIELSVAVMIGFAGSYAAARRYLRL
ncbi:hypothetical protein A2631_03165 [Candidatus Daviesbacteria bacterium RIFCSPHIGHO2_01_FULL_44_29]|uniref:Cell division protein FtsX n=1 Tax=Candidatus Daviesbacteria bacterium RIFCSPHIGHO2_02_FULL_43_12 TaxID=1797776 RepID=A0A1F5KKI3_9BACT|nr:MAG: hypothetical protein A2631_03165 [Candidatus Daviesbacteria bacterium RIFCSPHIGHO2_01_FULL_44_29]OGE40766.1 MAG: hypothetical protein A3E86_02180 [Candidatus Daviesbacteria bacterium RIFCSPHIGHO2_12_FULL_47_45]OGE41384.1 MAG: hypothetical protein A3D25_02560 [Candidatus Daviesbacteria bacterium RIFCSPHIGHO2_02_FULL_43_12]OGE69585.1 MAG: hypothetical protein A3B55_04305 [Candidatus Daviesbacteria bacterium RIFCSPLOWO2_01_FULL_43_15]